MYNTNAYNTAQYNDFHQLFNNVVAQDDVVFNDFSFSDFNVITSEISHDEMPGRNVKTFDIPRDNGKKIVTDFYRLKAINISGIIRMDTKELLNSKIDEMKSAISKREGNLDIKINDVTRRFIATQKSEIIFNRKHFNITYVKFKVSFDVYVPFGSDVSYTSNSLLSQNSLSLVQQIDNSGTAVTKPIFHILLNAVSNVTKISFENTTINSKISISETFSSSDVLIVDSENKTVYLNGIEIEYSGTFFDFLTGTNSVEISVEGDSVLYNLTTKYKRNFL